MELVFLGTAAAGAFPAPFCSCDVCAAARKSGGKDLRLRSSALLDGVLKIDNGPDTAAQSHRLGLVFDTVRTILFTHTHADHLYGDDFFLLAPSTAKTMEHPVTIIGPGGTSELIIQSSVYEWVVDVLGFQPVNPFVPVTTPEGYLVSPLLARHVPEKVCLNYVITAPSGKSILYATDTGTWPSVTWDYLEKERPKLDLAVMEATAGLRDVGPSGVHLDFKGLFEHRRKMMELGILNAETPFFATHFSHNGCMLHEEMETVLAEEGIAPAYDGLRVEV